MNAINSFKRLLVNLALLHIFLSLTSIWGQTRTSWQMNRGEGVVSFGSQMANHGDTNEYAFATIPAANDLGWSLAPDSEIIGFDQTSALPEDSCRDFGDFTYFQTFAYIPADTTWTEFTVTLDAVDDGARVTVFNSSYPDGIVIEESYVFLAGSGVTGNLASLLRAGETNRIVVTHVDDCPYACVLGRAEVNLDGKTIIATPVLTISPDFEGVEVRWKTYEGYSYQLQYADTLPTSSWAELGEIAPGNGSPMSVTDSTVDRSSRFYRLLVLPQ